MKAQLYLFYNIFNYIHSYISKEALNTLKSTTKKSVMLGTWDIPAKNGHGSFCNVSLLSLSLSVSLSLSLSLSLK